MWNGTVSTSFWTNCWKLQKQLHWHEVNIQMSEKLLQTWIRLPMSQIIKTSSKIKLCNTIETNMMYQNDILSNQQTWCLWHSLLNYRCLNPYSSYLQWTPDILSSPSSKKRCLYWLFIIWYLQWRQIKLCLFYWKSETLFFDIINVLIWA